MRIYGTLHAEGRQTAIILTTEHSASSYGIPVVIDGLLDGVNAAPHGPSDLWRLLPGLGPDAACRISLHGRQPEVTDAARQSLLSAGFPLMERTNAEYEARVERAAEGMARLRIAYDDAIYRGEVDG